MHFSLKTTLHSPDDVIVGRNFWIGF